MGHRYVLQAGGSFVRRGGRRKYRSIRGKKPLSLSAVILSSADTARNIKETSALHQSLPLPVWNWFLEVKQKLMPVDKHFLLSGVAYVLGDNSGHQSMCLRDKVRTQDLHSSCFEHSCADFVLWEMHDAS